MTRTLLIADDNAAFARMIAAVATRRGWDCVIYRNGLELIDGLREMPGPALLILDILMPDLDGIETVVQLKQTRARQDLRIRFITGGDRTNAIAARLIALARAFDVGTTLYKPLTLAEIDAVLTEEADLMTLRGDQAP